MDERTMQLGSFPFPHDPPSPSSSAAPQGTSTLDDRHHRQEVVEFLRRHRLESYGTLFLKHGFDDMATLMDIQEMDLEAMEVPLGHRRRLQRAIAQQRGTLGPHEPLVIPASGPLRLPKVNGDLLPQPLRTLAIPSLIHQFDSNHNGSSDFATYGQERLISHSVKSDSSLESNHSYRNSSMNSNVCSQEGHCQPTTEPARGHHDTNGSSSTSHTQLSTESHHGQGPAYPKEPSSSSVPAQYLLRQGNFERYTESSNTTAGEKVASTTSNGFSNHTDTTDPNHKDYQNPSSSQPPPRGTYKKRPRKDIHAPIPPKTAYQMFMTLIREELKDEGYSFTELAQITSDRWKHYEPDKKDILIREATEDIIEYKKKMEHYKKTPQYQEYQEYLKIFELEAERKGRLVRKRK